MPTLCCSTLQIVSARGCRSYPAGGWRVRLPRRHPGAIGTASTLTCLKTVIEWIYFLKNETIEENFQAKGLKQAKEQLDILKLSWEARRDYDAYVEDQRYQTSMYCKGGDLGAVAGLMAFNHRWQRYWDEHLFIHPYAPLPPVCPQTPILF
ncbi:MAG: hypothetical protein P8Y45_15650 [Exilibacterium sp.]